MVIRAFGRFSAAKCAARVRAMRAKKWCARGAYVCGAFRRVEAAERAYDRVVARRFAKRCAAMRSCTHFAAAAARKSRASAFHARTDF
eukprot:1024509-Lingulodinium_polyedra.AAC.1